MYKIPLQNSLISTKGVLSRLLQLLSRHLRRENLHWPLECFGAGKSCAAAICWSIWWYAHVWWWLSICCNDLQCLMTTFYCQHRNFQPLSLFSWTQVKAQVHAMRLTSCRHWHMPKQRHSFQTWGDRPDFANNLPDHGYFRSRTYDGTYPSYPEAATSTHNRPQIWPQLLWKRHWGQKGLPESAASFRSWRCGEPHRCHHNPPTHAEASWGASSRWIRYDQMVGGW